MLSLKDLFPEKEQVGRTIITVSWMMERQGGEDLRDRIPDHKQDLRHRIPHNHIPDPFKQDLRAILKTKKCTKKLQEKLKDIRADPDQDLRKIIKRKKKKNHEGVTRQTEGHKDRAAENYRGNSRESES